MCLSLHVCLGKLFDTPPTSSVNNCNGKTIMHIKYIMIPSASKLMTAHDSSEHLHVMVISPRSSVKHFCCLWNLRSLRAGLQLLVVQITEGGSQGHKEWFPRRLLRVKVLDHSFQGQSTCYTSRWLEDITLMITSFKGSLFRTLEGVWEYSTVSLQQKSSCNLNVTDKSALTDNQQCCHVCS